MTAFVGREDELGRAVRGLSAPRSFLLIEGDAGMGKSRLLAECLRASEFAGPRVAAVECLPSSAAFPLAPLIELLHAQPLRELALSPLAGALRPLLPEWSDTLPAAPEPLDDPQAVLHRILRAVVEVVEKLALDVLVVEDVHWADAATLEFLLMLTARPPDGLRLALTCRQQEVPADSPLLLMTARSARMPLTRISLEPLDACAARTMVAEMFEMQDVSASFTDFLHRRTDGVPLLLQESLALLLDRGDIVRRGGEWARRAVEELAVPPTIRDSVLARVERLDPAAQALLQAAAVVAEPADEALLTHVAGLADEPAHAALAQALRSGLLVEARPGRFQFRHVLAAQAVEGAVLASERPRLHARAGAALSESGTAQPAALCRHFRAAHDLRAWATYGELAADRALETGDDRAAVLVLLDLVRQSGHPAQLRLALARKLAATAAWGVAGLPGLGEQVVDTLGTVLASGAGPAADLAEIRLLLGRLLLQLGEFDAAAEQTEMALGPLTGRPQLTARAMMSLAWPRGGQWPAKKHLEYGERAAELLPSVADPDERLTLDVDRLSVMMMLGQRAGWDAAQRLAVDAATLVERRQRARLLMNTGHVGVAWGRDGAARQLLDEAVELMTDTGYRRLLNSARLTSAYLDWLAGRWDGLAERIRSLAAAEETLPEARLEARGTLAMLEAVTGDRLAARTELEAVLDEEVRRGVCDGQLVPAAALGALHLADGRLEDALVVTDAALAIVARKDMWLWGGGVVVARLDALVAADRPDGVDELVCAFAGGLAGTADMPSAEAALATARGIAAMAGGRPDEAVACFRAASQRWAGLPRPYAELLTLERLVGAELAVGADEPALVRLLSVHQRLRDLGARTDADRLALRLRNAGVDVARTWRGGRRGYGSRLSPREREVALLVSRGLTNRQVAQRLFLSPRTVDRHLGAAMRKLQVTSRTALAVAVTRGDVEVG